MSGCASRGKGRRKKSWLLRAIRRAPVGFFRRRFFHMIFDTSDAEAKRAALRAPPTR
jgi:hypothetical protein